MIHTLHVRQCCLVAVMILASQMMKQRVRVSSSSSYDLLEAVSGQITMTQRLSQSSQHGLAPAGPSLTFPRALGLFPWKSDVSYGSVSTQHKGCPAQHVPNSCSSRDRESLCPAPSSLPPCLYLKEKPMSWLMCRACRGRPAWVKS